MKRIIWITVILIIVIGGGYAYYLYKKQTPDITNGKPDVAVTAKDLLDAFNKDSAAARKQYVDKIVEVTGNVKKIDTTGSLVLGEQESLSEVVVGFDRRHMKDYEKLKLGTTAVVQGICSGARNENSSSDPTDLLAGLGTTVELRSAGVKNKK